MPNCFARNCKNSYAKGFVMLRFPRDDQLREKWRIAVGKEGSNPTPAQRLCEVHFERNQWEKYRCRLKSDALPTLFCNCAEEAQREMHPVTSSYESQESDLPVHLSDHMYSMGGPKLLTKANTQPVHRVHTHLDTCFLSAKAQSLQKNEGSTSCTVGTHAVVTPTLGTTENNDVIIITQNVLRPKSPEHSLFVDTLKKENDSLKQEVARLKSELRIKSKLLAEKERKLKALQEFRPNRLSTGNSMIKGPYSFPPGTILLVKETAEKAFSSTTPLEPVILKNVIPSSSLTTGNQKDSVQDIPPKAIYGENCVYSSITESLY